MSDPAYKQLAWHAMNRLDYEQYDRDMDRELEADAHVVLLGFAMGLVLMVGVVAALLCWVVL
ncbi:MAG: hypothetical protein HC883_00475 [Bdellovibrionaceae bacterium]|nr:hypothetical protein [Pseudobdellovibrionaceae bacterium]